MLEIKKSKKLIYSPKYMKTFLYNNLIHIWKKTNKFPFSFTVLWAIKNIKKNWNISNTIKKISWLLYFNHITTTQQNKNSVVESQKLHIIWLYSKPLSFQKYITHIQNLARNFIYTHQKNIYKNISLPPVRKRLQTVEGG